MVELLGPVTRVASLITVSWSVAKWFWLETLSTLVALILKLSDPQFLPMEFHQVGRVLGQRQLDLQEVQIKLTQLTKSMVSHGAHQTGNRIIFLHLVNYKLS